MSLGTWRVNGLTRRVESIRKADFDQDFDFDQELTSLASKGILVIWVLTDMVSSKC